MAGKALSKKDRALFAKKSAGIQRHADELAAGDAAARAPLVAALLDEFGTGRVMFRNTRAALSGFPERKARLVPLDPATDGDGVKLRWLAALLKELGNEKVLLICRTRALAEEIHERLQRIVKVNAGLFHEGLTLLQRDRNAAYFAEEDGARILICSEIGSEGRNFQFAHHLVLYDLPTDPELLEQRIGRLDRIGQSAMIQIHVPYLRGSDGEVFARWFHEGLNALEKNLHGAAEISHALADDLAGIVGTFDEAKLAAFTERSRELRARVAKKLERGHDRLLELSSCKPERAAETSAQIRAHDADAGFEEFFVRIVDHFGVQIEDLSPRTFVLRPGQLTTNAFPALPEDGLSVTFDRVRALSREDLGFLTTDHPLVRSTLDLLLGSESGNAAFGVWKSAGKEAVFIETYFVVECVAPSALHVDRFLPATPLRVVVDHACADQTGDEELPAAQLEKGDVFRLLDKGAVKHKFIPAMLRKAQTLATERMQTIVAAATAAMEAQLRDEIERLEDLRAINDHVRPEEIAAARQQLTELQAVLATTGLRLDALRLILNEMVRGV